MIQDWWDQHWQAWRHRRLPQSQNLVDTAYRLAAEESARYQIQHMRSVPDYATDLLLHRGECEDLASGVILEFGVATGRTLRNFARARPDRECHGFDSWQGLPETWTWLFPAGSFRQAVPRFREPNIRVNQGLFADTLPAWLDQHPDPIALVHMDMDLYSSACTVLDLLEPRLVPGVRIIFDEYMNYPGWQQDEFRAWQQYCERTHTRYRYRGRVTRHQQVSVEIVP